jgi:hypothetical protein
VPEAFGPEFRPPAPIGPLYIENLQDCEEHAPVCRGPEVIVMFDSKCLEGGCSMQ